MTTTKWVLDPTHSELSFKIKHLMIASVSGSFKNFQVEMETEDDGFGSAQIRVTADMNSINTNNEQRDAHLRNADFFETEKYPELKFVSSRIDLAANDEFELYGDLTMKGVTKPVRLNVEYSRVARDPWGSERTGFVVTGKINRSEWGVTFNSLLEAGGFALGEEVKLTGEIQMIKQAVPVAIAV
ncbi:MAG TPA: YceI family protein [Chitinophagaceae bacterium]